MVLFHLTPREYRTEELQLTAALADLESIAIEKSIQSDEQRKEEANREIAAKIAGILKSTALPNDRFNPVVAEIRRTVPCERCVIAGINPGTGKYRVWSEESDGIVEAIAKPFRRETLLNAIAKVLNYTENKKIV